jgi:triosephosphate isomerase
MSKIIAGNWKMNGTREMLDAMTTALADVKTDNTIIICPPFTLLPQTSNLKPQTFLGSQDCSAHDAGAYTGEVSAAMIAATGAKYVIVGHSERRQYHNESNEIVRQKAERAIATGLTPIICVGETMAEKEAGTTTKVIETQLRESIPVTCNLSPVTLIIAYEPRWAIGAGLTPTMGEISVAHDFIANVLAGMGLAGTPILYGASVKGSNAAEIMGIANVDGVLVGGASLKLDDFIPIITAV